ncbi:hypothetical protein ACHAXA_000808 [Cyclostephanos tholiformis]|uniref:Uncharacterized protein n=1 Tax=Cyclostephanos tholiformis TaxID=382380 RepID=A0ABD3R367_9STRA
MPSMPSMPSIPRPRELREQWQPGTSNYLLFAWALSSLLAAIIPVCKWTSERNAYFAYYGEYKLYEKQQRQYEQQANGNWNGSYYNSCGWWDFKCKYQAKMYQAMYGNNGGNQQGGQGGNQNNQMRAVLPGWYYLFGGSIEMDDRQREEMGITGSEEVLKLLDMKAKKNVEDEEKEGDMVLVARDSAVTENYQLA